MKPLEPLTVADAVGMWIGLALLILDPSLLGAGSGDEMMPYYAVGCACFVFGLMLGITLTAFALDGPPPKDDDAPHSDISPESGPWT